MDETDKNRLEFNHLTYIMFKMDGNNKISILKRNNYYMKLRRIEKIIEEAEMRGKTSPEFATYKQILYGAEEEEKIKGRKVATVKAKGMGKPRTNAVPKEKPKKPNMEKPKAIEVPKEKPQKPKIEKPKKELSKVSPKKMEKSKKFEVPKQRPQEKSQLLVVMPKKIEQQAKGEKPKDIQKVKKMGAWFKMHDDPNEVKLKKFKKPMILVKATANRNKLNEEKNKENERKTASKKIGDIEKTQALKQVEEKKESDNDEFYECEETDDEKDKDMVEDNFQDAEDDDLDEFVF